MLRAAPGKQSGLLLNDFTLGQLADIRTSLGRHADNTIEFIL